MRIVKVAPNSLEALNLMEELSKTLENITGDSGKNSFNVNDISDSRALFVIAYDDNKAVGCGAIRPIDKKIGEIKRVYAKAKGNGIGGEILSFLEGEAKKLGYSKLWLETRLINTRAVAFYEHKGYSRIKNYGKYAARSECVCFEKLI